MQNSIESARNPRLSDVATVLLPTVLTSSAVALGLAAVRLTGLTNAMKVARLVSLLLASLLAGNAAGTLLAVHPALRGLPLRQFFEAERALTRQYAGVMRILMPLALVSDLALLRLMPDHHSTSHRLTQAATASIAGVLATTAVELPINRETLRTSPEGPLSDWLASRERWDRLNLARTAFVLTSWIFLCLAALTASTEAKT
jgi:hypothetical protein